MIVKIKYNYCDNNNDYAYSNVNMIRTLYALLPGIIVLYSIKFLSDLEVAKNIVLQSQLRVCLSSASHFTVIDSVAIYIIETFKIFNDYKINVQMETAFTLNTTQLTRGHPLELSKKRM